MELEISNRSDRQRELRALVFLPDDHRGRGPMSGDSDVPALWYGETEFPYEGHQQRPDLYDTEMNCMWVQKFGHRKCRRLTQISSRCRSLVQRRTLALHRRRIRQSPPLFNSEGRKPTDFRTPLTVFQSSHPRVPATALVGNPSHPGPTHQGSLVNDVSLDLDQPLCTSQIVPPAGNIDDGSLLDG
jgi:hypothetical protein